MKKNKISMTVFLLAATLGFSTLVKAQEISLPVITKPAILEEGTQRQLSQAQINELLPWAKDSKIFLLDLLESIQGLSTIDKIERLSDGIASVVGESAPKNSELLMRYALNRGLVLKTILSQEMGEGEVGTGDAKLRVLRSSIEMALKYYETDMAILAKKSTAPYVLFGLDYFEFLSELNKSIFDASAQYTIQRTALEWLQWDLYRDLNNVSYAPQIVKINNNLKTFPSKKITDSQALANIRLLKKIAQQLNVRETLKRLEEERRLSMARNEEERRLLIAKSEAERIRIKEEAELERLRGSRSLLDIEKVKAASAMFNSGAWATRQDAAINLSKVIGGDVTLILLNQLVKEADGDVINALMSNLPNRVDSQLYLLKIESLATHRANVLEVLSTYGKQGGWAKRRLMASIAGRILTVESYRLLGSWLATESDGDVKKTIKDSMESIDAALNR